MHRHQCLQCYGGMILFSGNLCLVLCYIASYCYHRHCSIIGSTCTSSWNDCNYIAILRQSPNVHDIFGTLCSPIEFLQQIGQVHGTEFITNLYTTCLQAITSFEYALSAPAYAVVTFTNSDCTGTSGEGTLDNPSSACQPSDGSFQAYDFINAQNRDASGVSFDPLNNNANSATLTSNYCPTC